MRSFLLGVAALALAAGCGASVSSTVMPGANLGHYHTYAFYTPPYRAGAPATPSEQEVKIALANSLAQKGITEAAPGQTPDFLVAFHARRQQKIDVTSAGYGWGWWGGGGDVYTYTVGTLVVDFVDPSTKTVFWRGTASQVIDNPYAPNLHKIDKAVAKLVDKYPATMTAGVARPMM